MAGGCFPGHNISIFILWITATSEIVRKRYCVPPLQPQPSERHGSAARISFGIINGTHSESPDYK